MNRADKLDTLARRILIGFLAVLPFLFVPASWVAATQAKVILLAVVLIVVAALWAIGRYREGVVTLPHSALLWTLCVLPVVYALSTIISGSSVVSVVGSGTQVDTLTFIASAFVLFFLYTQLFAGKPREVRTALLALVVGGLVLVAFEVLHFALPALTLGGVFSGQTANIFGSWSALVMAAGLFVLMAAGLVGMPTLSLAWRIALYVLALVSLFVLVVAGFVEITAAVCGAIVFLLLVKGWRLREYTSSIFWKREWVAAALAILTFILIFASAPVQSALPNPLQVSQVDVRPSWQGTFTVAQQSLSGPVDMLFGTGPNTFTRQWGLHKPAAINQTPFWNTNFNVGVAPIPTSLVTVGALGFLAWLAFALALLWSVLVFVRNVAEPAAQEVGYIIAAAAVYLFALHVYMVPGPALALLLFALSGLLIALIRSRMWRISLRGHTWAGRGYAVLLAACFVGVLAATTTLARAAYAEALVARSVATYNATQSVSAASAYISQALGVFSGSDSAHRAAVELGLLELQQLNTNAKKLQGNAAKQQLRDTLQSTIQHGLAAVSINSNDYQNWLELASVYAQLAGAKVKGAYDNAHRAYEHAIAENPGNPLPLMGLAQLDALQGNATSSLAELKQVVKLKPDYAAAHYLASQLYASQGDLTDAAKAAASAAEYASSDPQAWYNLGTIQFASGNDTAAQLALKQSLTLEPKYANALYVLGLSYYRSGNATSSLTTFRSLNQLDPNQKGVEQYLKDLQAGKTFKESTAQQAVPGK